MSENKGIEKKERCVKRVRRVCFTVRADSSWEQTLFWRRALSLCSYLVWSVLAEPGWRPVGCFFSGSQGFLVLGAWNTKGQMKYLTHIHSTEFNIRPVRVCVCVFIQVCECVCVCMYLYRSVSVCINPWIHSCQHPCVCERERLSTKTIIFVNSLVSLTKYTLLATMKYFCIVLLECCSFKWIKKTSFP